MNGEARNGGGMKLMHAGNGRIARRGRDIMEESRYKNRLRYKNRMRARKHREKQRVERILALCHMNDVEGLSQLLKRGGLPKSLSDLPEVASLLQNFVHGNFVKNSMDCQSAESQTKDIDDEAVFINPVTMAIEKPGTVIANLIKRSLVSISEQDTECVNENAGTTSIPNATESNPTEEAMRSAADNTEESPGGENESSCDEKTSNSETDNNLKTYITNWSGQSDGRTDPENQSTLDDSDQEDDFVSENGTQANTEAPSTAMESRCRQVIDHVEEQRKKNRERMKRYRRRKAVERETIKKLLAQKMLNDPNRNVKSQILENMEKDLEEKRERSRITMQYRRASERQYFQDFGTLPQVQHRLLERRKVGRENMQKFRERQRMRLQKGKVSEEEAAEKRRANAERMRLYRRRKKLQLQQDIRGLLGINPSLALSVTTNETTALQQALGHRTCLDENQNLSHLHDVAKNQVFSTEMSSILHVPKKETTNDSLQARNVESLEETQPSMPEIKPEIITPKRETMKLPTQICPDDLKRNLKEDMPAEEEVDSTTERNQNEAANGSAEVNNLYTLPTGGSAILLNQPTLDLSQMIKAHNESMLKMGSMSNFLMPNLHQPMLMPPNFMDPKAYGCMPQFSFVPNMPMVNMWMVPQGMNKIGPAESSTVTTNEEKLKIIEEEACNGVEDDNESNANAQEDVLKITPEILKQRVQKQTAIIAEQMSKLSSLAAASTSTQAYPFGLMPSVLANGQLSPGSHATSLAQLSQAANSIHASAGEDINVMEMKKRKHRERVKLWRERKKREHTDISVSPDTMTRFDPIQQGGIGETAGLSLEYKRKQPENGADKNEWEKVEERRKINRERMQAYRQRQRQAWLAEGTLEYNIEEERRLNRERVKIWRQRKKIAKATGIPVSMISLPPTTTPTKDSLPQIKLPSTASRDTYPEGQNIMEGQKVIEIKPIPQEIRDNEESLFHDSQEQNMNEEKWFVASEKQELQNVSDIETANLAEQDKYFKDLAKLTAILDEES